MEIYIKICGNWEGGTFFSEITFLPLFLILLLPEKCCYINLTVLLFLTNPTCKNTSNYIYRSNLYILLPTIIYYLTFLFFLNSS